MFVFKITDKIILWETNIKVISKINGNFLQYLLLAIYLYHENFEYRKNWGYRVMDR